MFSPSAFWHLPANLCTLYWKWSFVAAFGPLLTHLWIFFSDSRCFHKKKKSLSVAASCLFLICCIIPVEYLLTLPKEMLGIIFSSYLFLLTCKVLMSLPKGLFNGSQSSRCRYLPFVSLNLRGSTSSKSARNVCWNYVVWLWNSVNDLVFK